MCCSKIEKARKLPMKGGNGGFVPWFLVIPCGSLSAGSDLRRLRRSESEAPRQRKKIKLNDKKIRYGTDKRKRKGKIGKKD